MKVRVQRRDGRIETIQVVGPVEVHHGEKLDHFHAADGMDHYFTNEGFYDGWGQAAPPGMTPEDAGPMIERIERERKIED